MAEGRKNRKIGRNKLSCLKYRNEQRYEKNKLRRLRKHLKKFPADTCAKTRARELEIVLPTKYTISA